VEAPVNMTIMPYFSPDTSSSTMVDLINSAQDSIQIGTPGFSSWSGCTPYDNTSSCVKACTPSAQRSEKFPIFPALLNAVHRGIKVTILTNDYGTKDCAGTISPLPFLALNGIEVRYFNTVTFLHTKFMVIDGHKASVSSINFSRTSFTRNREAGAVLAGTGAQPIIAMMRGTYEADWAQGNPLNADPKQWSASDLSLIQNKDHCPVVLPNASSTQALYYNPPSPVPISLDGGGGISVTGSTSPDFSSETLMDALRNTSKSLDVMIYQITSEDIAAEIIRLHANGVRVRLLVSSSIYGQDDCLAANTLYQNILTQTKNGVEILKTTRHYMYSHQKFWIFDGSHVGWSTGNWSPSDFPADSDGSAVRSYVPYGTGWQKLNRDFQVYVRGSSKVVEAFQAVFDGDRDPGGTFKSKVYPWAPKYPVACGA